GDVAAGRDVGRLGPRLPGRARHRAGGDRLLPRRRAHTPAVPRARRPVGDSPDFIDNIDFYAGVPPARFGRLLGGAIEATTAKPSDKLTLTGAIDLINASAFTQIPIDKTGTSVTLAARGSYTPLIGARIAQALIPSNPGEPPTNVVANFYDYQARIIQKLGSGKLKLLAFGSNDE